MRARDVTNVSSLYVPKKIHELDYFANYQAEVADGSIRIVEAPADALPNTRVMVLEEGRVVFTGSVQEFKTSELPAIKELLTLDRHDHARDPYFTDPWDKQRRPKEPILRTR
jgi:hypothetical protein